MHGAVFAKVLQMSLTGCYSIGIVLAVRLLLLRCGRVYAYCLWVLMFLGLCLPVSMPGHYSLIPRQVAEFSLSEALEEKEVLPEQLVILHRLSPEGSVSGPLQNVSGGMASPEPASALDRESSQSGVREEENTSNRYLSGRDWSIYLTEAETIWILGILFLGLYHLFAVCRMFDRCARYGRAKRENEIRVVEAADVASPFLWGFFRPVIYLPAGLEPKERAYILAHEIIHRNRGDHLVKFLILFVTILHWFNPLVWTAYVLCCQDMEISCDEAVLKSSENDIKKAYAESLLKYAAAQNRFLIRPLGFGEPSVKSRIKHVLHFRKKSIWISAAAGLCVIGVAVGLWHHPSKEAAFPEESVQEAEPLKEGETPEADESEGLVANNGGEVICVAGEYYYMDGIPLYSDGEALYTSALSDDGTWHVCRYETDGSGCRRLFDGWIVDSTEYGQVLYCMLPAQSGDGNCLGWYDTQTGEIQRFAREDVSWLGKYNGFLYISWKAEDGLHVDRVREIDRTEEPDLIKEGIPGNKIWQFYADEGRKRLVFAVGKSEGDVENSEILCYSYGLESGELVREELTGLPYFAMMDGSVYFQRYKSREDHTLELFRTDYEFQGEEQIGEGLTLLCAEKETNSLLARKDAWHPDYGYVASLVRIWPDQKEEQMLLDMEQMLPAVKDGNAIEGGEVCLDWEFQAGDRVAYSELNSFGDRLYVTISHMRDQENTPLEKVHLTVSDEGGIGVWSPDEQPPGFADGSWYMESLVGQPLGMEAGGWDLENAIDVREHFQELPAEPDASGRGRTYLLGETRYWTLYGKGDYESMLLVRNGRYTEIHHPYGSDNQTCPELMETDLDRDGITELAIRFKLKHETDESSDTLLVADFQNNGAWVYRFWDADFTGQPAAFSFDETEGKIQIWAKLGFYDRDTPEEAQYNGCDITADVVWTGETFTVKNINFL